MDCYNVSLFLLFFSNLPYEECKEDEEGDDKDRDNWEQRRPEGPEKR